MLKHNTRPVLNEMEAAAIKAYEHDLADMDLNKVNQELAIVQDAVNEEESWLEALTAKAKELAAPKELCFYIVWNAACNEGFVTDDCTEALAMVGANDPLDMPSALAERFKELNEGDTFTITKITLEDHREAEQ